MNLALFITNIIISVIVFYIAFFKSYIIEKGKNLATQEDIGRITSIVESIKKDLNNETELLKARLALNNQNKFSIKSAERDALFKVGETYSAWLYSLINFSFINYDQHNFSDLDKITASFDNKQYEFDLAMANLRIFMNDVKLVELLQKTKKETLKLESIIELSISNYKFQYRIYNIKVKDLSYQDILPIYNDFYNSEIQPLLDSFFKNTTNSFKEVHTSEVQLKMLLKERIDQIEEE